MFCKYASLLFVNHEKVFARRPLRLEFRSQNPQKNLCMVACLTRYTGTLSLAGKADSLATKLSVQGVQLLTGSALWQFAHLHLSTDTLY